MELDNLIGEVEAMANKTAELAKREYDLRNEFAAICEGNFEKIVLPYVVKMNKVVKLIHDKSNVSFAELKINLLENSNFYFDIIGDGYGIRLYYHEFGSYGKDLYLEYEEKAFKKLVFKDWKRIGEYFLSEEKAHAFEEELSGYYRTILERFRTALSDKNAELAEAIKKLEDTLKGASAPKENVDGTVEFHINGKTYVGTVKEE